MEVRDADLPSRTNQPFAPQAWEEERCNSNRSSSPGPHTQHMNVHREPSMWDPTCVSVTVQRARGRDTLHLEGEKKRGGEGEEEADTTRQTEQREEKQKQKKEYLQQQLKKNRI